MLLRLVREHDVLLESFRPGVMERLGVGYERLREENPGLVYCAITGYGQDGPYTARSGHDMNYLGLNGLLGLTGDAGGPPVQAAGQIADIGGGALMARVRHPRRAARARAQRRGPARGRVDVRRRRWPGWRWWPARYLAEGQAPERGELELAGSLICYRPYACKDGWVTLGALEPKFWQAWCRGVGREDLIEKQFERPAPRRTPRWSGYSSQRTRDEWHEFASEHDCCLEPVLGLDEALDSELVRAREMVVRIDQPGTDGVSLLGVPVKLSRTPGAPAGPGPALGEHTREVLRGAGVLARRRSRALIESGAAAGGRRATRRGASWREPERPAQDEGAGRGERRQRRARSSTTCARGCWATATGS